MRQLVVSLLFMASTVGYGGSSIAFAQGDMHPHAQVLFAVADSLFSVRQNHPQADSLRVEEFRLRGMANWYAQNWEEAFLMYQKALDLAQESDLPIMEANSWLSMWLLAPAVGEGHRAAEYLDNAYRIWQKVEADEEEFPYTMKVTLARGLGERQEWMEVYQVLKDDNSRLEEGKPWLSPLYYVFYPKWMSEAYHELGVDSMALRTQREVLSRAFEIEDKGEIKAALYRFGFLFREYQQYDSSLHYYFKELNFIRENNLEEDEVETLNNIGYVYYLKGQDSLAIQYSQRAIDKDEGLTHFDIGFHPYGNLLRIYLQQGRRDLARVYIEKYDSIFQKAPPNSNGKDYPGILYPYFLAEGDTGRAFLYYQAHVRAQDIEDRSLEVSEYNRLQNTIHFGQERALLIQKNERQGIIFRSSVVIGLGILLLGTIGFVGISRIRRSRQEERHEAALRLSELKALRAQINPHFIFNALSSIQRYILNHRPQEANRYLTKFSRFIRMVLHNSDKHVISLEDELLALDHYLEIEQLRLSQKLAFSVEVADGLDLASIEVPSMLLQTFAENAIWHGISPKAVPGHMWVRVKSEGGNTVIDVEDDGIGREAAQKRRAAGHRSKGLQIVEDKIRLYNQSQGATVSYAYLDLYDDEGVARGTCVRVTIAGALIP